MSSVPYTYIPLGDGQIRLLRRTKYGANSIPSYTLDQVTLSDGPAYQALSYTWGPPFEGEACHAEYHNVSRDIQIVTAEGSHTFAIGRNLFEALHAFFERQPDECIWADAICINQDDLDERAAQVRIMEEIYFGASCVFVWTGLEHPRLEHLYFILDKLAPLMRRLPGNMQTIRDMDAREVPSKYGIDLRLPIENSGCYLLAREMSRIDQILEVKDGDPINMKEALPARLDFFRDCRWCCRVWILQEVIAAHKIIVQLGDRSLSWEDFVDLSRFPGPHTSWWSIDDFRTSHPELMLEMSTVTIGIIGEIDRVRKMYHDYMTGGERTLHAPVSLYQLLLKYGKARQASEPRDRVFFPLGLAARVWQQITDDEVSFPEISYTKSVKETHIDWTTWLLGSDRAGFHGLFELLGSSHNREDGLPSWAPDYSDPNQHLALPVYDEISNQLIQEMQPIGTYQQVGNRHMLALNASQFDTIVRVITLEPVKHLAMTSNQRAEPYEKMPTSSLCLAKSLLGLLREVPVNYCTGEPSVQVVAACLLTPRNDTLRPAELLLEIILLLSKKHIRDEEIDIKLTLASDLDTDFVQSIQQCHADLLRSGASIKPWTHFEEFLSRREHHGLVQLLPEFRELARTITSFAPLDTIYLTKAGRLGRCHHRCQPGDEIWCVGGVPFPVTVRAAAHQGSLLRRLGSLCCGVRGESGLRELVSQCTCWGFSTMQMMKTPASSKLKTLRLV